VCSAFGILAVFENSNCSALESLTVAVPEPPSVARNVGRLAHAPA
jgi:hypothetical protein